MQRLHKEVFLYLIVLCLINHSSFILKMTFDERRPLTEDDLWQKTTFDEGRPLTEDDLWQMTTFDGRRHSSEDDLWQKMTFVDENLWEKTTKSGRRTLAEDDLLQKTTLAHTPHQIYDFLVLFRFLETHFFCQNPNLNSTQPQDNLNWCWVWYEYDCTNHPPTGTHLWLLRVNSAV